MDPTDRDGVKPDAAAKAALSWEPMKWEPERWRNKGMPADVEKMMTEGVQIKMDADAGSFAIPQYPWPTGEALLEATRKQTELWPWGTWCTCRTTG